MITKDQRQLLAQLHEICNTLGGSLDGTATHPQKIIDRQRAHLQVSKVIYYVLCDHPDNDEREYDIKQAKKLLKELDELTKKQYKDRNGI